MAPVFATTITVASMDKVIAVNVKNRMIWPRVILVHQGAVEMGSASIVGDIMLGSESLSNVVMSPKGDAEERDDEPKGDAGLDAAASPAIGGGALVLGFTLGAASPPANTSFHRCTRATSETACGSGKHIGQHCDVMLNCCKKFGCAWLSVHNNVEPHRQMA